MTFARSLISAPEVAKPFLCSAFLSAAKPLAEEREQPNCATFRGQCTLTANHHRVASPCAAVARLTRQTLHTLHAAPTPNRRSRAADCAKAHCSTACLCLRLRRF